MLEFELRASHLLGRRCTAWATPPALFGLIILKIGSHFLSRPAWIMILLCYASQYSWMAGAHHHAQLFSVVM
jgi:hypothetical protein